MSSGEKVKKTKLTIITSALILLIFILIILLVIMCVMGKYILLDNGLTMNPNLIKIEQVSIESNELTLSGSVLGNSFYGDYSGCTWQMANEKLFLSFHSSSVFTNPDQTIKFEITDDSFADIEQIYLRGNNKDILIWQRR